MVHVNCWLMEESRRRVPQLFQEESVQFKRINSTSMTAQENRVIGNCVTSDNAYNLRDSAKRWREPKQSSFQ